MTNPASVASSLSPTVPAEGDPTATQERVRVPYPVRVLLVVVAMLVNIIVTPMVLGIPLQLAFNASGKTWPEWILVATGLIMRATPTLGAIGLVWLLMKYIDHRPVREAGLVVSRRSLPLALVGIACSLVAIVPAGLALTNAGLLRPETGYVDGGSPLGTFLTVVVLGLLTQGFPEELLWRGYALQTMRHRPRTALVVSGVVFGAMHFISQAGQQNVAEHFVYASSAMAFGLLAGALAIVTRSLWPAVGVHFGVHLAYYVASLFDIGTGPWLWASEALLFGLMAAIVVLVFRRSFSTPIDLGSAGQPGRAAPPASR